MTDRVSGSGGCNRYVSSYQEEDGKLSMGPVASTRMFCAIPDGTMQQEQEYFKALQAVTEYDISANRQTLKLLYGDRKNNLLYTKKEELR
jgi:heat shock protein HslJ